jgi:hypothetical protein
MASCKSREGKRNTKKNPPQGSGKKPSTRNSYEVLNQLPDTQVVEDPHQYTGKENTKGKSKEI